mmetsp:Transcript_42636/g.84099  ORF Transcript_42636/g.84099 Transcript_42636/m.84099 type:complete len:114 (-) Transcript_42636:94-435(-)
MALQWPHHGAKNLTKTNLDPSTTESKLSALRLTMSEALDGLERRTRDRKTRLSKGMLFIVDTSSLQSPPPGSDQSQQDGRAEQRPASLDAVLWKQTTRMGFLGSEKDIQLAAS